MTTGEQLVLNSSLDSGTALDLLTNPSASGVGGIEYINNMAINIVDTSHKANISQANFDANVNDIIMQANITDSHTANLNE